MKPKNFPERKRQRQLKVLERLRKSAVNRKIKKEIQVLEQRTKVNLRDVRTKKNRSKN